MNESTVHVINNDMVLIAKDTCRAVLMWYDGYIIVFKPDITLSGIPFIVYCAKFTGQEVSLNMFNKWFVGLCSEPIESNYFAINDTSLHLNNGGKLSDEEKAQITKVVLGACDNYRRSLRRKDVQ